MAKKDLILIPRLEKAKRRIKKKIKAGEYLVIFPLYLILLVLIVYLPIDGIMKVLSLLIGSFILFDIHHSLKRKDLK